MGSVFSRETHQETPPLSIDELRRRLVPAKQTAERVQPCNGCHRYESCMRCPECSNHYCFSGACVEIVHPITWCRFGGCPNCCRGCLLKYYKHQQQHQQEQQQQQQRSQETDASKATAGGKGEEQDETEEREEKEETQRTTVGAAWTFSET